MREVTALPAKTGIHFTQDRDYLRILQEMQQGQWDHAVLLLSALQERYPHATEIADLLHDATFRASLESQWGDKVKGIQGFQLPLASLQKILPMVLISLLLIIGVLYYSRVQRVNALSNQQQELLAEAQSALSASQYTTALELFATVLAATPDQQEAIYGQRETQRQMKFATDYQLAQDQIQAGNHQAAFDLLTALQRDAPGYRDVTRLLESTTVNLQAPQLLKDADFAFTNQLWVSAITQYEALRQLNSTYEAEKVQSNLAIAYLKAAQQMAAVRPDEVTGAKQVQNYLDKAAALQLTDTALDVENRLLAAYLAGERLLKQSQYDQAAAALLPLYTERPAYFAGYVADLLYKSYMGMAEQYVQQQDLDNALAAYQRAIELGTAQSRSAEERAQAVAQQLAPTPTPTPIPVYVAPAPVVAPVVAVAPAPVVEPTPVLSWQEQYRGWIAFRSTKDGGEQLYIMRADGSDVQPAPADIVNNFAQLYQKQQWSPDGNSLVYVQQSAEQGTINLFKVQANQPGSDTMLTSYAGTEYDPVWSADGQSIAFVANHTGNDEIWLMSADGSNQRQLTFNQWEWDKHPSFSPDGQRIVFYSNRSGPRQIWAMNADGSNQINLNNNQSDAWDPVWIR